MNLYLGNLSFKITEDELREIFSEYGTIKSLKIISDRETGRSRGFGFVELEEREGAEKAIEELNGKEILGRELKINESKPKNV